MRASHLPGSGNICPHSHPDKPCMLYVFVEYALIPLESQNPRRVEMFPRFGAGEGNAVNCLN